MEVIRVSPRRVTAKVNKHLHERKIMSVEYSEFRALQKSIYGNQLVN